MYKYSRNWLQKLAGEEIDYKDFDKNWLDLQGFEVATEVAHSDDIIVELEVKANRPDMLSHLGVLREYYVYKNKNKLPNIESSLKLNESKKLPIEIEVDTQIVDNLVLIEIKNVDNTKQTPIQMKSLLENLGVNSISPIVDISNYICLEIGQPIHIYDLDKIKNKLVYKKSNGTEKITSLNGSTVNVPQDCIIICDEKNPVCLAGIVGTQDVEVDENTKNILIESAHFDMVRTRIASQKTHISTLASYRFERGVDSDQTLNAGLLTAQEIIALCGGEVGGCYVNLTPKKDNIQIVNSNKINKILGTNLDKHQSSQLLNKYYYKTKIVGDDIECVCPRYRLDLEQEVDIIADVAQMYGYHNIEPTTANVSVAYEPNQIMINSDILRNMMISQGLNECISYSFIPENAMKSLLINEKSKLYGDIKILNPLSNKFAVMRSNMIYSMLATYIYNLTKNGECEPIFELGTTFYRDTTSDTGYNQNQMLSVLLCGSKYTKGFGLDKNINYDIYDIKALVMLIANEYSIDIKLVGSNEKCFKQGKCAEIYINGKYSGILGELNSEVIQNLENGKLVRGEVLYMELCVNNLTMGTTPIKEISKFPSVVREYNLLIPHGCVYEKYSKQISASSDLIQKIEVKDIYNGKGVSLGYTSVLISIEYHSSKRSLELAEIEQIELTWLEILKQDFDIGLKN